MLQDSPATCSTTAWVTWPDAGIILLSVNPPWTLIANPAAGRGRSLRAAERCAEALRRSQQPVIVRQTTHAGHATQLASEAAQAGHTAVIACGGDGTVAEIIPALARTTTALGLLPQGTGNDLARALGIPRGHDAAVRLLLRGHSQAIDLGRCGQRWFSTVAAFGFDAEVSQIMLSGAAPMGGTPGYLLASLRHLSHYRPSLVRLHGDFGTIEDPLFLVAVANTRSYGGGLQIAPGAVADDGLFDVCLVDGRLSRPTLLSLLPQVFWGGHVQHPGVRVERTAQVTIEPLEGQHLLHADGEILAPAPLVLNVAPAALRVIRPTATARTSAYAVHQTTPLP